jgi:aspartate kinase
MKFGGTSVADAEAIHRVVAIVRRQIERQTASDRPPVVVVSALSKVTDGLLQAASLVEAGTCEDALARLDDLAERHVAIAAAVTSGVRRAAVTRDVRAEFASTSSMIRGLPPRTVSPPVLDLIAATGELASSRLLTAALAECGVAAEWIDARAVVVTDAEHTRAVPDLAATCARTRHTVAPLAARGQVAVLGGFVGATADGITTTLGRGGSDYSAAIVGTCLEADEIQIWTDVDGMLTADPRIVRHPCPVPRL